MDKLINCIKVNLKEIWGNYKKIVGALFSVVGVLALFWNITDYITSFSVAVCCILAVLVLAIPVAAIWIILKKDREIESFEGNNKLFIEFGDLFNHPAEIKVIAVNRCFDMCVNDTLISEHSVHGQWVQSYLKRHTKAELDREIKEQLSGEKYRRLENKKEGNKERYPLGTVVKIKDDGVWYYLLGLTILDEQTLRAGCTTEEYCVAILRLFAFYNKYGQGKDIAVPLLGANMARIDRKEKLLLQCMIDMIKLGKNRGQGNVHIVLHEKMKEKISLYELH